MKDKSLGRAVSRYRIGIGMSQVELAKRSKLGVRTVIYIEGGKHSPSISTLCKMAKVLKTAPSIIVHQAELFDLGR